MPRIEGAGAKAVVIIVIIGGDLIFSIGHVGVGYVLSIVAPGDMGQFIIPIPP